MSNKTLRREYIIAPKEVQEQYSFIFNGGTRDEVRQALEYIDKLPVLNKKPVKVLNRKGQMTAFVGTKGAIKFFSSEYNRKTWYFDGNRLGKRKRLLVEAFYDDKLLDKINTDGLDKAWKKISHRANF